MKKEGRSRCARGFVRCVLEEGSGVTPLTLKGVEMRKRRWVFLAVVVFGMVAVTTALGPAGASERDRPGRDKGTRKVSRAYSADYARGYTKLWPGGPIVAEVSFPKGPERFVSFEITDDSGEQVSAMVLPGTQDFGSVFCSSTPSPLPIPPNVEVKLELFLGICPDGTRSVPRSGTVEATFHRNLPLPRREITGYSPFYWGGGVAVPSGVITSPVKLSPGPGRFLSLTIEDESGGKVSAHIRNADSTVAICGETEKPIRVRPNFETEVLLFAGLCEDGTPSMPTTGTITATFSGTR